MDIGSELSFTYGEGGLLDKVDAIDRLLGSQGAGGLKQYFYSGFYGAASLIGVENLDNAYEGEAIVFDGNEVLSVTELTGTERVLEGVTGGLKLAGTTSMAAVITQAASYRNVFTSLEDAIIKNYRTLRATKGRRIKQLIRGGKGINPRAHPSGHHALVPHGGEGKITSVCSVPASSAH